MHRIVKKTLQYTGFLFLSLIVLLIAGISYLYFSADMQTPKHEQSMTTDKVIDIDSLHLRHYGDNFLRHSDSGLWELFVKGDAFQRGEAIGQLSSDLLHHQEKVFVDQIREIVPSDSYLKFLRFFIVLFNRNLGENVLEEYRDEIYGISLSCTHKYDFIGTPYERQLNYHSAHDLGHAMQDYMLVGCSSFATWGTQSADSSLLIGRNFDFYVGDAFAENKQVAFYVPEQGYRFASVGWPGMIGVLSGMNETGLTVTINAAKSAVPTGSATPISILTREILQYAATIDEAFAIAQKRETFVSESILIGSAKDGKAAIIEKSPEKTVLFTGKEANRLICTNHYQSEEFSKDERNMENIRTSDSPYRFARLTELINEDLPIDVSKAASILRDHKGLQNTDLGLANEMAINQFIAHHSVIFQPEKQLMWVSTSPWQCGKYVAYDLNKIFKDTIDWQHEIYSSALTIPEDKFIDAPEFQHLLTYKKLTPLLLKKIRKKEKIEESVLKTYQASNPSLYYVYEVIGDYYEAMQQPQQAIAYWQQALKRPIPKLQEKERIQQKFKNNPKMEKNPEIQFRSPEDIKSYQKEQLAKALAYLQAHSKFYQQMFAEHHIDINQIKTIEDLQQIPVTTKTDLQLHNDDFICVDKEEIIDYVTTSGTLGDPVTFVLTSEDLDRLSYNEYLSFTTTGCTKQDILQLMTTIDRRFMAGLAYYMGARELGMGVIRVGNGIPELQWDTIRRIHPTCGMVVPSFLIKLIEFAEKNHIDHNTCSMQKCICIGEALRNQEFQLNTLGQKIHDKWPALQLYSTYASTEMQSSFTECNEFHGGHLQPELIIVEFLDDNNRPVEEGEAGEVTITTLGVKGMPLLRFKTGDICYHHTEPCGCGRNTIRLSSILGRKGQMIKYKGTTLYPPALFDILDNIPSVKNYIIEVYTNELGTDEILIRIGSENRSEAFAKEIKDLFRSKVRVAPSINFESAEYIAKIQMPPMSRKTIKFIDLR